MWYLHYIFIIRPGKIWVSGNWNGCNRKKQSVTLAVWKQQHTGYISAQDPNEQWYSLSLGHSQLKNIVQDDFICRWTQKKLNFLYPRFQGLLDAHRLELQRYMFQDILPEVGVHSKHTALEQIGGSVPGSRAHWWNRLIPVTNLCVMIDIGSPPQSDVAKLGLYLFQWGSCKSHLVYMNYQWIC